jgi:hypothetical protein
MDSRVMIQPDVKPERYEYTSGQCSGSVEDEDAARWREYSDSPDCSSLSPY